MTANNRYTDTQDHPERTLVLNIDFSRGLVAALLVVAVVVVAALLVRGPAPASAAGEQISAATDGMRRYYLALPCSTRPTPRTAARKATISPRSGRSWTPPTWSTTRLWASLRR